MLFDVFAEIAKMVKFVAVDLENLIPAFQSHCSGGTIWHHFGDNGRFGGKDFYLPQAFPLPEFCLVLDGHWFEFQHRSIAFDFDGNGFTLATDDTPLHTVTHAVKLGHPPAINLQNFIARAQSDLVGGSILLYVTDDRGHLRLAHRPPDQHHYYGKS